LAARDRLGRSAAGDVRRHRSTAGFALRCARPRPAGAALSRRGDGTFPRGAGTAVAVALPGRAGVAARAWTALADGSAGRRVRTRRALVRPLRYRSGWHARAP